MAATIITEKPLSQDLDTERESNEVSRLVFEDFSRSCSDWSFHGVVHDQDRFLYEKVTVLESEKRAWESSPEAQAIREALNPWRNQDTEAGK